MDPFLHLKARHASLVTMRVPLDRALLAGVVGHLDVDEVLLGPHEPNGLEPPHAPLADAASPPPVARLALALALAHLVDPLLERFVLLRVVGGLLRKVHRPVLAVLCRELEEVRKHLAPGRLVLPLGTVVGEVLGELVFGVLRRRLDHAPLDVLLEGREAPLATLQLLAGDVRDGHERADDAVFVSILEFDATVRLELLLVVQVLPDARDV
mmetsp:Transcript_25405/g.59123  ORF Transcript_25405/g.59123 Transcript_25405/m.59123 type:complete len:211 (+) Transcript_25405:3144-3776(+)